MASEYWAITDGASRGNPGHAAIGVLIYDSERQLVKKLHRYLGEYTNNIAEYSALIACLEEIVTLGGKRVTIHSDSELMVKQFNGAYRIKNEKLRRLCARAHQLVQENGLAVDLVHVPRSYTTEADSLANLALDLKGV